MQAYGIPGGALGQSLPGTSAGLCCGRTIQRCSVAHRRRSVVTQASGSTFGTNFRVTTFGESHGKGVGCVVDGVPPRLPLTKEEIQAELDRRRPGQSKITTPRKESDTCEIYSGTPSSVGCNDL
jgi:chorismate synthase